MSTRNLRITLRAGRWFTIASVLFSAMFLIGCRGSFEIAHPFAPVTTVVPRGGGEEIVTNGDTTEVIEPPAARCFARARFFKGLVQRSCESIAEETRP